MANQSTEIGDIVKKVKVLLLDIEGTTTSISFVKDKLFPYAEENVQKFLDAEWEKEDVKDVVTALRKLALEDGENKVEGAVAVPGEDATKEEQIEGLVKNVKWQMSLDRKAGPLKTLQGLIWKQGYDNGDIKGHVFDDVQPALELWRSVEGQKVFIYSSGSVQAQKLLFGQSLSGDLLPHIDGHFDTAVGAKQEDGSYKKIVEQIGCKPDEVLFLTDILKEAEAAVAAGLHSALVSREGNAPLPADVALPVLHSLAQLAPTNKRKPQHQDEVPAKVPKTDTEDEVKKKITAEETSAKTETVEEEKMEVENDVAEKTENPKEESKAAVVETIVEEIKENVSVDAPTCDIEPIVEEKTDDKMETDETEPAEKNKVEETNGDKSEKVEEVTTITEIEEVANDKEELEQVAEIIEDLQPVVEEPDSAAVDMDELQNVGEVLEKECDEILSKVQDVTNLDKIAVKPLLNTITEDAMETENVDSNDIVDRILDTELELENEMKQCEDIDINKMEEIATDSKSEKVSEKKEASDDENLSHKENKSSVDKDTNVTSNGTELSKDLDNKDKCDSEKVVKETDVTKNDEKSESVEKVENNEDKENIEKCGSTEKTEKCDSSEKVESSESSDKMDTESTDSESIKNPEKSEVKENPEKNEPTETVQKTETTVVEQSTATDTQKAEVKNDESTESAEKEKSSEKSIEVTEEKKSEKVEETKTNGEATNGKTESMNGDASKEEDVNSRLAVENGGEVVNGANGKTNGTNDKEESSKGSEVSDIKVKTVAAAEPHTDQIEQPTEA